MKKFVLIVFSLLTVECVFADDGDIIKSYSYVEGQGGIGWTATDAKIDKLLMPQFGISFGHYVSPKIGFRFGLEGLQAKGRFEEINRDYKWKYFTANADILVNISNIITKNCDHFFNLVFVGGIGLVNAWDNDDMNAIRNDNPGLASLAWGQGKNSNRLMHNFRAGLRLETNVTKPLGLSLEIAANNTSDRFNSKTNNANDWMFTGKVGVSYRFGYKKQQPVVKTSEPAIEPQVVSEPVAPAIVEEKKAEKKPQPIVKVDKLHEEIFYLIRKTEPMPNGNAELQRVADFMKKHQDVKLVIVGYADRGTGNARVNSRYAEQRALRCKEVLVNQFGCDASRIITDSKGDTIQPFVENEKNRCVIIDAEAEFTVYE